jgi:hypothetical protein
MRESVCQDGALAFPPSSQLSLEPDNAPTLQIKLLAIRERVVMLAAKVQKRKLTPVLKVWALVSHV